MSELFLRGSSIGKIKGVLFDKDGTLENSEEYLLKIAQERVNQSIKRLISQNFSSKEITIFKHALASAYGIKENKLSPHGIMAIASKEVNILSTATIFSTLNINWAKSLSLSKEVFSCVDLKESQNKPVHYRPSEIIKGAREFLIKLKMEKIKAGIISNDNESGICNFIKKNSLQKYFPHTWSSGNHPAKPSPLSVIKLCELMRVDPTECALISDADTDLEMARDANIRIILGFTGGWKLRPDLNKKYFLFNSWDELNIHLTP